jgi:hypothetical protein
MGDGGRRDRQREREVIYFTTLSFAKVNSNDGS